MAAIDNLLASTLITEISSELTAASGAGRKIIIPFEALELAAQAEAPDELTVTTLMNQLATAKGWAVKVYFSDRKVEFSV